MAKEAVEEMEAVEGRESKVVEGVKAAKETEREKAAKTAGETDDPPDGTAGAMVVMGLLFILTIAAAMAIAPLLIEQDVQAVEDEDSALNPLLYLGFILVFTLFVLMVVRAGKQSLIKWVILGVVALTVYLIASPLIGMLPGMPPLAPDIIGAALGLGLMALIHYHPEWYVLDAAGLAMAMGVCAILGISFSIGPVLIMLIALAVYDAIAVYRTGHMVDLADSMVALRLPILLIIPKSRDYSYLEQKGLREELEEGGERGALFIGLGDIIIPGALCVSALAFLPSGVAAMAGLHMYAPLLVALGTLAGGAVGFAALMRYVLTGRPQAGLPLLNGGAIAGYVITYLAVYGDPWLGITFSL